MNYTRTQSQELGYLRLLFDIIFEVESEQSKDANYFKDSQPVEKTNNKLKYSEEAK